MKQKNFKKIYDKIYGSVGKIIEARRKATLRKDLITILFSILIWVFIIKSCINSYNQMVMPLLMICLVLTIILLSIITYKNKKVYIQSFKEQIIKEIVEQSNSNLRYSYKSGISSSEYAESCFDYGWDRYHTEDLIEGTMDDGVLLRMAQVHTEEEHESTDSDGHTTTTYVTTFLGLYGIIKLKTVTNADFMIKNNSKFAKFKKDRIEMESAEFEKYYDVYAGYNRTGDQRQSAMEILTPETIEEFVKVRNLFKRAINVRVCRDKIYFRIEVGDIFEPPTFKSSVDFEMLRKYFLIIDVPRMLYEILIDNILVIYGDKDSKEKRTIAKMSDEQRKDYINQTQKEDETSYFSHK